MSVILNKKYCILMNNIVYHMISDNNAREQMLFNRL